MTALDPWGVQLGDSGIQLGPGTPYAVRVMDGIERSIRESDTDRSTADGAVMAPDYALPKTVTFELTVEGSSPAETVENFDALAEAWNSARLPEGGQSTAALRFRLPGRDTQRLEGGRPRRLVPNWAGVEVCAIPVVATYFAPDPRILSDTQHVVDLVIGASNVTLPNAGNHPASVWWDVYGAITSPGLIRSEADRFDLTGVTIANGTYFRVRTDPRTVTRSSDSANRYQDISGDPEDAFWLEVPAGGALFRAVGTSPGVNAKIRATYRDCWL